MARKAFYSFHYKPDCVRASQVRNMGVVDGNVPVSDNDWETVTKGGDPAIKKWISDQMSGKSCTVVLVGSGTANRKWINYEISESWSAGKGVVGVYIHNLKDFDQRQSFKGSDPFLYVNMPGTTNLLFGVVKAYEPPHTDSKEVYAYISRNLAAWADEAVAIRAKY
jgi:hypothetical protein